MIERKGMIIESDRIQDPRAPRAQGSAPAYWYYCATRRCTRQIAAAHKYWPFCTICWHQQPERQRSKPLEVAGI